MSLLPKLLFKLVRSCRAHTGFSLAAGRLKHANFTDHNIVICTLAVPQKWKWKQLSSKKPRKKVVKYDVFQVRIGTVETAEFSEALESELEGCQLETQVDIEAICERLNAGLKTSMAKTLCPTQRSGTAPPWESPELAELLSKLKNVTGYVARRRATRQIKRLKVKLKSAYFAKLASEINFARQQRAVEREFRLSKQFGYGSQSRATYVTPTQFADHFR